MNYRGCRPVLVLLLARAAIGVRATLRTERTMTGVGVGVLQRSEGVLPPESPCPWTYEECKQGHVEDCIGPTRWGEICEKTYERCGTGILQSPIDIDVESLLAKEYTPQSRPLITMYDGEDARASFKNTGRGLELEGSFGRVQCGSKLSEESPKMYEAVGIHFHSPSEHTRLGEHFPLEMQIVHKAEGTVGSEDLLIVSLLFEEKNEDTPPSPFLESLIKKVPNALSQRELSEVNLNLLSGLRSSYIRYKGSVSTPPCDESVQYMVMSQIQPATSSQLEVFRKSIGVHGNARPTQPLAGRSVEFVDVTQFYQDQWKPTGNANKSAVEAEIGIDDSPLIVEGEMWA